MSNLNDGGAANARPGRVDPAYPVEIAPYHAPVAERRGFWSRFWWLIPLVLLLIALPFVLRSCDNDRVEELASSAWVVTLASTLGG